MYKTLVLMILVVVGIASAAQSSIDSPRKLQRLNSDLYQRKIDLDFCPECIQEAVQIINILLNIVLDEGIIQSCSLLCDTLANKTGSVIIGDVCTVACEALGVDEFVKMLVKGDLDPIYYCELVDLCPINDHGDAKFTSFSITPAVAPEGSTFVFDCSFISVNGTGTGTIVLDFIDPKNRTFSNLYWFVARPPGKYPERIGLQTLVDFNCDPSQGICDGLPVGNYSVTAQVCNGECGSKHPHSSIYDSVKGAFEITKKKVFFT